MTIKFQRNGKTFTGQVVSKGFFKVDAPESYEVNIGPVIVTVPVSECEVV